MRLVTGGVGALLLCAAWSARAQDNAIGPAQLKDFSLQGRTTQSARPQPQAPPVVIAPPPTTPQAIAPDQARSPAPTQAPRPLPAAPQPQTVAPAPQAVDQPAPRTPESVVPTAEGAPTPAPIGEDPAGGFPWLYLLPLGGLALLGLFLLARRRRHDQAEEPVPVATPAAEPLITAREKAVRPEPVPRPWLELGLKAERATATLDETVVQFELEIANTGKAAARNLRIDVKMFNAGKQQDTEIGAFFRVAGRESSKCTLPGIPAGTTGVIHGQVTMKRDDMRAVRVDEKLLFVPVIAVNALYDWGEAETGQTSKSYVVGRELETSSEKMGAFRVDLGPRVWRTIGQRQHKLARQV